MRILITGGAGCLGSNLTEHYLALGHEVFIIDNFATGKREVFPDIYPGLTIVEGSVADRALVEECFARFRPSHVIHSAAAYKEPQNWVEDARTNIEGTVNTVAVARATGVERFINLQTALCYGRPKSVPIPLDHPLQPFTSYGISKTAGEQYIALSGLPAVSLRLASVTGPRLAIGPIPTFYKRLKAGQDCVCSDTVRDFLDMSDFIAVTDLLLQPQAPTGIFNISTGEGHSIKEIFDIVSDHLGIRPATAVSVVPARADDVRAVVLDPSETEARLGWRARVGFEATIRAILAWYDRHGISDVYSHLAAPAAKS